MSPFFYQSKSLSTNDEVFDVLLQNNLDFGALYTFNQTKGKGQYGNSWKSDENLNIAYSIAVKANEIKIPETLFNFYTANILRNFLDNLTQNKTEVKWPNDIIINGKKVCGMLTEKKNNGKEKYFIIGIGINVLQENFENLPKAGSILTQTGLQFDLNEFAEQFHFYFSEKILEKKSNEEILEEYNKNLFKKDKISVFEIDGLRQNGIIKSCDEQGFLWIDLENSDLQKFYHKELEMLY